MKKRRRWHAFTAMLVVAPLVAACGSQSDASEAERAGSEQPAAEDVASQEAERGAPPAERATPDEGTSSERAAPSEEAADRSERPAPSKDPARTEDAAAETPTPSETTAGERSEAARPAEGAETSAEPAPAEGAEERSEERVAPAASATVEAGTDVSLELDRELSTKENRKGDSFTATVSEPVIEGSRVLIPEGATVRGTVTAVQKAQGKKPAVLKVDFASLEVRGERQPLVATLISVAGRTEKEMKGEAKKIGGGAAAGGLVGAILGKDAKGALIGAAVGSAAGTAITLATREEHAVLPAGTPMKIRVEESVRVRL